MQVDTEILNIFERKDLSEKGLAKGMTNAITYTIPIPDTIQFFDKDFKAVNTPNKEKKDNTPYFICNYFNPDRFSRTGDREFIEETDIDTKRMENWDEAGRLIIKNQKFTCSNKISKNFITGSIDDEKAATESLSIKTDTDIIILLFAFTGKTSVVLNGFVMCEDLNILPEEQEDEEELKENALYIDVICSNPRNPRTLSSLSKVSFGRKLLDYVVEFGKSKDYFGIVLSSLMYVINYYRKYGFRHIPKLTRESQTEEKDIEELAEKNLKNKFSDDAEIEDLMYIELIQKTLGSEDDSIKKNELKKYWNKRDLLSENDDINNEIINKLWNDYTEKYEQTDVGQLIKLLLEKGFSTQRVHTEGAAFKRKRSSKRQLLSSSSEMETSEGFRMAYSFADKTEASESLDTLMGKIDADITDILFNEDPQKSGGGKK